MRANKIKYDAITVTLEGVPLTLVGKYLPYKWNGYMDPPDLEEFEIDKVLAGGVDIGELLTMDQFELLQERALESADGGEYWRDEI